MNNRLPPVYTLEMSNTIIDDPANMLVHNTLQVPSATV